MQQASNMWDGFSVTLSGMVGKWISAQTIVGFAPDVFCSHVLMVRPQTAHTFGVDRIPCNVDNFSFASPYHVYAPGPILDDKKPWRMGARLSRIMGFKCTKGLFKTLTKSRRFPMQHC